MGLTCIRNRINTGMGRAFAMALALFCLALPSAPAFALDRGALPSGGAITSGSGSISAKGSQMTVNQTSQKMIANWDSFNIGADAGVTFNQPNAGAAALNRISGKNPSQIMGRLSANGQVFLINPAGILFGSSAKVNVGGLVASSLDIGDEDFLKGNYTFDAAGSPGTITNVGTITADGGYVAFLSPVIKNTGTVTADQGTVAMAAADKVSLDLTGDGLITYTIDQGAVDAQVENQGLVRADGGLVFMSAEAAHDLTCAAVNNTGIVRARTLGEKQGRILLMGDMDNGQVLVGGTLDASAPAGGDGGFIETSAKTVTVADDTTVSTLARNGETGTWLIDPTDFTIESGSGSQTISSIGATTLSNSLGSNNISITTSSSGSEEGDINVNAEISWNAATTLTLTARDDININADITAASGNLTLNYGQSSSTGAGGEYTFNNGATINLSAGNHFTTKKGYSGTVTNWTVITDLGSEGSVTGTDLQGINGDLTGNYVLGADINASGTSGWNSNAGFTPLGDETTKFTGNFNGLGHTITNLYIYQGHVDLLGLFGFTQGAMADYVRISNVGLTDVKIIGHSNIGGLVGRLDNFTAISNCYVTGEVTSIYSGSKTGGLAGSSYGFDLSNNYGNTISNCYSTAAVVSDNGYTGGLIGYSTNTAISNCYATGLARSYYNNPVGGLAGKIFYSTIRSCYATGAVSGVQYVGSLIGIVENSTMYYSFYVYQGLSGIYTYFNSTFYNVSGLSTSLMKSYDSFSSYWDISDTSGSSAVWRIYEGSTYPLLRNFLTSTTVTAGSASRTYNRATTTNVSHSIESGADASLILGGTLVANTDKDVGTYTGATTYTGLYSTQQGYDISYVNGTVEITPATLAVNAASNKVYDGTDTATISNGNFTGYISGDDVTLAGTFADKNAGTGKTVSYGNSLGGSDAGNYVLDVASGATTADITAKTLTVGGTVAAGDKEYDGNTTANISGNTITGRISGDTVSLSQSGSFADKNVGAGKTITYTNSLGGTDAGNYALNVAGGTTTADITAKTLTVGGTALAADKVYDGTTTASISGNTVTGQISGDTVIFSQSAAFSDKNAGTGKAVTIANSLSGADAGNYLLDVASDSATADINPKTLSVTGTTAADKVYDGTTDATLSGGSLSGLVSGEFLSLSQTSAFADKNAGTDKTVTYTNSISGAAAVNYVLDAATGTTTADITPASLTVTGAGAKDKTYDGTVAAVITGGAVGSGVIGNDDVTLSSTGSFSDKNAGTGKTVFFGLAGADAGNYQATTTTTADIIPAALVVTANDDEKVQDGTAYAGGNGVAYDGFVWGEDENALDGSLLYGGSSQGAVVEGSYIIIPAGLSSDNYTITFVNGTLAITDQRPVNSGGVSETQKNDTRTRPDISEKAGNTTASPGKANTLIELTNVTMQNNSPMTLASNTGLTSVRFQHRGETHTLFTGNEETVESQANISALSIFSRTTNGSVDALGSYTVKQGMTTISLTKSGETAVSNLDTGNLDPSDTAQFSFDTTDGIVEMTAGITQSGVLVISGVDDTSGLMTEQAILIGLQAVKQDLGVSIGSLNAVIINNK